MRKVMMPLLLGLVAAGATGEVRAQQPASNQVPCAIVFTNGKNVCYSAAGVQQAERQAPFAVRPSAAVSRTLHIGLVQVIVRKSCSVCAGKGNFVSTEVDYLYGKLVGDYGRTPPQPLSVMVMEGRGRSTSFQPKYVQHACGTTVEISQAALDHPYRAYGPWYLRSNFTHHNTSLSIVANLTRANLTRLACNVLQAG